MYNPAPEAFMSNQARVIALATFTILGAACADSATGPERLAGPENARSSEVKFWNANASANWNERATSLAARRPVNVARLYAYLSLAQFRAAEAAEAVRPHPPTSAAIGGASVAVLRTYFPA